jgi:hypothetical protein
LKSRVFPHKNINQNQEEHFVENNKENQSLNCKEDNEAFLIKGYGLKKPNIFGIVDESLQNIIFAHAKPPQ